MKIKAIIVDELPKSCKECAFGQKFTVDDGPCDFDGNDAIEDSFCPLVLEEDYTTLKNY